MGLVIEGQDFGSGVDAVFGDSEYEYWVTIDREHLDDLTRGICDRLGVSPVECDTSDSQDKVLLGLLKNSWDHGIFTTDVDFRAWVESIGIPSGFSSYA